MSASMYLITLFPKREISVQICKQKFAIMCRICSKLTVRHQTNVTLPRSGVLIINFEHIQNKTRHNIQLVKLVQLFLTLTNVPNLLFTCRVNHVTPELTEKLFSHRHFPSFCTSVCVLGGKKCQFFGKFGVRTK